ncbi:MAG: NfeD family protein [bacterium]|nr:NfeD family protein [bacterium]
MTTVWLIVFLALIFLEFATISLVSIWFAIGALASLIFSLYFEQTTLQIAVFVVVSAISLLLTKKFVNRVRDRAPEKTNLDRVVGKIGIVTADISKLDPGEVKVDGKKWMAVSTEKIKEGSKVLILNIDGVKLQVEEMHEDE